MNPPALSSLDANISEVLLLRPIYRPSEGNERAVHMVL